MLNNYRYSSKVVRNVHSIYGDSLNVYIFLMLKFLAIVFLPESVNIPLISSNLFTPWGDKGEFIVFDLSKVNFVGVRLFWFRICFVLIVNYL